MSHQNRAWPLSTNSFLSRSGERGIESVSSRCPLTSSEWQLLPKLRSQSVWHPAPREARTPCDPTPRSGTHLQAWGRKLNSLCLKVELWGLVLLPADLQPSCGSWNTGPRLGGPVSAANLQDPAPAGWGKAERLWSTSGASPGWSLTYSGRGSCCCYSAGAWCLLLASSMFYCFVLAYPLLKCSLSGGVEFSFVRGNAATIKSLFLTQSVTAQR